MIKLVTVTVVCMLAAAADARAQAIGFNGGIGLDPTQGYVGTYFETAGLGGGRIHLRPGIDGAFGNDVSEAIIDVFFVYKTPLGPFSPWTFHYGFGPVVSFERFADQVFTHGGFGSTFGMEHRSGFFFEFKASGGGGPNLMMGVGYRIGRQEP